MRRLCLAAVLLVAAVAVTTTALARPGQQPADPVPALPPLPTPGGPLPPLPAPAAPQYVLKVGDTMRLEDGSIGCQVTRRAGRAVLECRPAGALRGRYGTFVSDRTVTVARFRTSRTAQVVFTARHKRGWRVCGKPSRAARAAGTCR
jgi:hypothetical protein